MALEYASNKKKIQHLNTKCNDEVSQYQVPSTMQVT